MHLVELEPTTSSHLSPECIFLLSPVSKKAIINALVHDAAPTSQQPTERRQHARTRLLPVPE